MCSLRQSVVEQLESVQRGILGRIQSLPDRVAIVAVYGLLGIRPIEQELDIRKLSLFATVMFEALLEHEIAQRQLAVKDINLDSWFTQCNLLLHKYGLSNAYLIDSFQTKGAFKEAISRGWINMFSNGGMRMLSLNQP